MKIENLSKLLELIADNSNTTIRASGINVEDEDIRKIARVINKRTTPIKILDLSENDLSDRCVRSLLKIKPSKVYGLNLHNNNLTDAGACRLSESELFSSLTITRNNLKLDNDIVKTLAQHFMWPKNIKCIDGNRVKPGTDRNDLYDILAHRENVANGPKI